MLCIEAFSAPRATNDGQRNRKNSVDVWEKWDWLWSAIFYTTVFASTGLMLLDDDRTAPVWAALLLTGILLLWHWGGLRLAYKDGDHWDERALLRFIIIIGDIILWFVLVNISPAYYVLLFGLFSQVFRHLPLRYAIVAASLLTAGIIFEQLDDSGEPFR